MRRSPTHMFRRLPTSVTWLLPVNVLIFAALSFTQPGFLREFNLDSILSNLAITVAISLGQMVVIAAGDMNLALGAIGTIAGLSSCYLMLHTGIPVALSIGAGLAVGALAGAFNGFIVGQFRLSAFIVTLATGSMFTGVALGLTKAQPLGGLPASFLSLGNGKTLGLPTLFILGIVAAIVVALLVRYTNFGRQLLALGGNRDAAILVGIRRRKVILAVHTLSGFLAAWAGVLSMARLGQGQPNIGSDWLLSSFAAPIIGGTLFTGGYLSVAGTCLGAALLTLVSTAAVFLNINTDWVLFLQGVVVVLAAVLERVRLQRSTGAKQRGGPEAARRGLVTT